MRIAWFAIDADEAATRLTGNQNHLGELRVANSDRGKRGKGNNPARVPMSIDACGWFRLIKNAIQRCCYRGADGSLSLHVSHRNPAYGSHSNANWSARYPAPNALLVRLGLSLEELDGSWEPELSFM